MAKTLDRVPRKLARRMRKAYNTIDSTVGHEGRRKLDSLMVHLRGKDVFLTHLEFRDLLIKRRGELFPSEDLAVPAMVDFFIMFEMMAHTEMHQLEVGPRAAGEQKTMDGNLDHMMEAFTLVQPRLDDGGFELIRSVG